MARLTQCRSGQSPLPQKPWSTPPPTCESPAIIAYAICCNALISTPTCKFDTQIGAQLSRPTIATIDVKAEISANSHAFSLPRTTPFFSQTSKDAEVRLRRFLDIARVGCWQQLQLQLTLRQWQQHDASLSCCTLFSVLVICCAISVESPFVNALHDA